MEMADGFLKTPLLSLPPIVENSSPKKNNNNTT